MYREYLPCQQLQEYVECYWTLKCSSRLLSDRELIIPGGRVELMFNTGGAIRWFEGEGNCAGTRHASSFVLGQRDKFFYATFEENIDLLGVRFKPGGFSSYTRNPLTELLNQVVPLDAILARPFHHFTEHLAFSKNDQQRTGELEKLLLQHFNDQPEDYKKILSAVKLIGSLPDLQSLDMVRSQSGLNYKSLERKFLKYLGYTPKEFTRILRFYRTVRSLKNGREKLTSIGLENGYFDQSHFIKEVKAFTGYTPKKFQQHENRIVNILVKGRL